MCGSLYAGGRARGSVCKRGLESLRGEGGQMASGEGRGRSRVRRERRTGQQVAGRGVVLARVELALR